MNESSSSTYGGVVEKAPCPSSDENVSGEWAGESKMKLDRWKQRKMGTEGDKKRKDCCYAK